MMFDRFFSLFRSRQVPQRTVAGSGITDVNRGAGFSVAGCCATSASLDEAAGGATSTSPQYNQPVLNPTTFTPAMLATLPFIEFLSIGGAFAGYSVYQAQNKKIGRLQQAQEKATSVAAPSRVHKAYVIYLQDQLKKAKFEKRVAGILAPAASSLVGPGQFFPGLGTVALAALTVSGGLHIYDSIHALKQIKKEVARAGEATGSKVGETPESAELRQQDAAVRLAYFKRKQKDTRLNLLGWGAYTAGMVVMTAAQLGAWGISMVAPPAMSFAAAGAIIAGVAVTIATNNKVTGVHTPGLPEYIDTLMEKEGTTHDNVRKLNIAAHKELTAAESYGKTFRRSLSVTTRIASSLRNAAQGFLALLTFGFVPAVGAEMRFANKVRIIKHATTVMDAPQQAILQQLQVIEQEQSGNAPTEIDPCGDRAPELKALTDTIVRSGHYGPIMKILAWRVLEPYKRSEEKDVPQKNWFGRVKKDPATGQVLTHKKKVKITDFRIKQEYADLLGFLGDNTEDLKTLRAYAACCNGNYEGGQLLEAIRGRYCSNSDIGSEQITRITTLLREVTHQYLVFQLGEDAGKKRAAWSHISDSFDQATLQETAQSEETPVVAVATPSPPFALPSWNVASPYAPIATSVESSEETPRRRPHNHSADIISLIPRHSPHPAPAVRRPAAVSNASAKAVQSNFLTKQEAQIIAKTLLETQNVPPEYIPFKEIMRTKNEDGSVSIVYQDPYDVSPDKRIMYVVDTNRALTVHHGNAATAIIPVNRQSGLQVTGIEVHTIFQGQYEGGITRQPIAVHGSGESVLKAVTLIDQRKSLSSVYWQGRMSTEQSVCGVMRGNYFR